MKQFASERALVSFFRDIHRATALLQIDFQTKSVLGLATENVICYPGVIKDNYDNERRIFKTPLRASGPLLNMCMPVAILCKHVCLKLLKSERRKTVSSTCMIRFRDPVVSVPSILLQKLQNYSRLNF